MYKDDFDHLPAVSIINQFCLTAQVFLALISAMSSLPTELPLALSEGIAMALIRIWAHLKVEGAVCFILLLAN